MSFDGQVDCQRIEIGPVWPLAIIGKPSVAAPAMVPPAVRRKRRRDFGCATADEADCLRVMDPPGSKGRVRPWRAGLLSRGEQPVGRLSSGSCGDHRKTGVLGGRL